MTAEEYYKKEFYKEGTEKVNIASIEFEDINTLYQLMTDYLNSQIDTIFMKELEKRLPSEDEIYKQAVLECNPFLPDSAKWLIQYLKK